jgi:type I restriction enzyme M protein
MVGVPHRGSRPPAFSARSSGLVSNPPYGQSWKTDLDRLGGKDGIKDPRFVIKRADDPEFSLVTRSSGGQLEAKLVFTFSW